jgi:hypothetical protein
MNGLRHCAISQREFTWFAIVSFAFKWVPIIGWIVGWMNMLGQIAALARSDEVPMTVNLARSGRQGLMIRYRY